MKTQNNAMVAQLQFHHWHSYSRFSHLVLLSLILIFSTATNAQNLSDFASAAGSRGGTDIIPYPAMRKDAENLAKEVDSKKSGVQTVSYDVLLSQKNNLLEDNKKIKSDIEGVKKEIEEFKKKYPDGSSSSFEDEIKKKEEKIRDNNSRISDLNSKIKEGAEAFGNLATARANLRVQFENVLKELSNSKSSPAKHIGESPSDTDKSNFEKYINIIEDEIEIEAKEHKVQEDGARGTQEKLKTLADKNE